MASATKENINQFIIDIVMVHLFIIALKKMDSLTIKQFI